MKGQSVEERHRFAGLTRHNNDGMTERAARVTGMDAEHPPETSFASTIRALPTADTSSVAWRVPTNVAKRFDENYLAQFNADMEEAGIRAYQASTPGEDDTAVFIETDRFQSFYSPEVLKDWLKGDTHETLVERENGEIQRFGGRATSEDFADEDVEVRQSRAKDALWHVPSQDASVTNPVPIYGPLEEAIREEELGDAMFGEIRTRKRGGEVHMDILFDAFTIEFGADVDPDDLETPTGGPIVLGIRTGYDFFGERKLYAEGFAQDTSCDNSIRAVTDRKTRRAVGDVVEDVKEWWQEILQEMDLMTDQLTEAIEASNLIDVDILEMNFAEAVDHNDDLVAFYELAGFPTYLAEEAASDVESRADDPFEPTMWDLHSGATFALTHEYRGSENTSRMDELTRSANDMLLNPSQAAERVERTYREAIVEDDHTQGTLSGESVSANVERFTQRLEDQREEFETRAEQLRNAFLDTSDDEVEA